MNNEAADNRQKIMISFLERDYAGNREKTGRKIFRQIERDLKQLEEMGGSKSELTALRACYEAEYNDSAGSTGSVLAAGSFLIAILQLLKLPDIENVLAAGAINIVGIGAFALIGLYILKTVWSTSRESAKFRNRIMAVNILIAKKEENS